MENTFPQPKTLPAQSRKSRNKLKSNCNRHMAPQAHLYSCPSYTDLLPCHAPCLAAQLVFPRGWQLVLNIERRTFGQPPVEHAYRGAVKGCGCAVTKDVARDLRWHSDRAFRRRESQHACRSVQTPSCLWLHRKTGKHATAHHTPHF